MVSTPSWLKEKVISPEQSIQEKTFHMNGIRRVLEWIKEGLWSPVPAYTLAVVFLILVVFQGRVKQLPSGGERLIALSETTGLWMFPEVEVACRNEAAGQDTVLDESKALYREPRFEGMSVQAKKGSGLFFSWPEMEGTKEYKFTLISKSPKGDRTMVSVTTQIGQYDFSYKKYGKLVPDRLHEWYITGKYGDNLQFKAKSSFILAK